MWRVESNRGEHPTLIGPQTKWGRAKGHFQQLDNLVATWSQRTGEKLDPMNFTDGLYMAALQMKENMTRYGDQATAVKAYHGGTNQKNWGAKTVDYVAKVLGDAPAAPAAPQAQGASRKASLNEPTISVTQAYSMTGAELDAMYAAQDAQPAIMKGGAGVMSALNPDPVLAVPGTPTMRTAQQAAEAAAAADVAKRQGVTFGQKFEAAYQEASDPTFRFVDRLFGDLKVQKDDPLWKQELSSNWQKYLGPYSEDEREKLLDSNSKEQYDAYEAQIKETRARNQVTFSTGMGSGIAASLLAGLVEPGGFAAGMGVAKGFQVARIGAGAGRAGMVAASAAEGALGNVAYDALMDASGEFRSGNDYAMSAGFGLAIGGITSIPSVLLQQRSLAARLQEDAVRSDLADVSKAVDTLGPSATPEAIRTEVLRAQAQRTQENVSAALAPAPERDRIPAQDPVQLSDELSAREPAASAMELAPTTETPEFKNWFGDSKVVGQQGEPVVVYHGTQQTFDVFDTENGRMGPAAWFTPNRRLAEGHAKGGTVMEVYLSIKNPYIAKNATEASLITADRKAELIAQGYDGIYEKRGAIEQWVAFEPTQIKSATSNRGTFDPADDRIAFEGATVGPTVQTQGAITSVAQARAEIGDNVAPAFESPDFQQRRIDNMTHKPEWAQGVREIAGDLDYTRAKELPAGVHIVGGADKPELARVRAALEYAASKYIPEARIILSDRVTARAAQAGANGEVLSAGNVHYIGVREDGSDPLHTALHELGHAIVHNSAPLVPASTWARVDQEWLNWVNKARSGKYSSQMIADQRFAVTSPARNRPAGSALGLNPYVLSRDEYLAEQFVKHFQAKVDAGEFGDMPVGVIRTVMDALRKAVDFIKDMVGRKFVDPDEGADELFRGLLDAAVRNTQKESEFLDANLILPDFSSYSVAVSGKYEGQTVGPAKPRIEGADYDMARKYGLDLLPQRDAMEKAEFKVLLDIAKQSEKWAADPANAIELTRAKTLTAKSNLFASTGLLLANSANPTARMVAGTLTEVTTGALGRRKTAAISAAMRERVYVGNTLNEYQQLYTAWRNAKGGHYGNDLMGGKLRDEFDKAVAREIEARGNGSSVASEQAVKDAADALEKGYDRMRVDMQATKTVGHARLGDSSVGYMPHVMQASRVAAMSDTELRALVDAMTTQFEQIEGWDAAFAGELARKYVDHARINANGGHEIPANIHSPAAGDMVRTAIDAMNLPREERDKLLGRYARGGASFTKQRLRLDLNKEYAKGDGTTFTLLDLFDTNQIELFRNYSRRAAGEVALAQHGIMGSQGLRMLRRAMEFGPNRATQEEIQAFDQVAAEFLGQPFGEATGKWMSRAMTVNSLARLGGMGFTQFGEYINGIWHVGAGQTLAAIGGMKRLRQELIALSKGETVNNSILNSIETWGGAGEFGAEGYRMVLPFDNPDSAYKSFGGDTVTAVDKMLRAGTHAQGILSGWRMLHAVQTRGMAEQIVHKAVRYISQGDTSRALSDMGFTPDVVARLKADMPNMAKFEGGKLKEFDLSKATDVEAAAQFAQAVQRGASQIIQGTFIGETGKWAHSGLLKMMTQFRTFSITSMEKQWARQRGNHGVAGALGMLLGSMSVAVPIIYARTLAAAANRPDREAYLEKQLTPAKLARATLNYVAMAGLAGDFADALSAVTGLGQEQGSRSGGAKGVIGNLAGPAAGYVDDAYKALQNLDDPHKAAQLLPFNRLPYLVPVFNGLRKD
jgi:hypothetical protein